MFKCHNCVFGVSWSLEQFNVFSKEGGLLPSFSIRILELPNDFLSQFSLKKRLGDYVFYESKLDKHYFSYKGCLLALNSGMEHADIYLPKSITANGKHELSYLSMQAYMFRLVNTGNFMIHSAAVVHNNQGILFCGKSGAGKSTQANLWKEHLNSWVLNYDKPCVIQENGNAYVHGSPWSGKEALFLNKYVPLKAIVFVKQAKENNVVKLSAAQAYANIYLHNYVYPITQDIEEKYKDIINSIAITVPTYELSCDISENAVKVLYNEIFTDNSYLKAKEEHCVKYKIKDCFEMKQIADEYVVIARGAEALKFNASVVFNESGAFLWDKLTVYVDKGTLTKDLAEKYNIDIELASNDVDTFLNKLSDNNMLDCE